MNKLLTVAIPTYNRREQLLRQLDSIFAQAEWREVELLVLDNHSDYDVAAALREQYGAEVASQIRLVVHPYNMGLAMNITWPFYHCRTPWCWTVSDDDLTLPGSIARILGDIQAHPDSLSLKYSLEQFPDHHDTDVASLDELVSYYKGNRLDQGEFIFLSNIVTNIARCAPVMGDALQYAYDAIGHLNPTLYGLDAHLGTMHFSSQQVVAYIPPPPDKKWNVYRITKQCANLLDYPFQSSGRTMLRLQSMFSQWGFDPFMQTCEQLNDRTKAKIFFDKVFDLMFMTRPLTHCYHRAIFRFFYLTGINIKPAFVKLRHKLGL